MSITASEARRRLFPLIEEVNGDQSAIEIVSKNGSAYLVAAEEYEALRETAYLLRSPANARRLLRSYQNALDGEYESRELIRDDADEDRP
ncbi:type II toxin-antitoxin system prevent-host-death family antitoxin [Streptomyces pseudoechinosporeus]|jgi:antitoxin YefM|uniref:type II toxin-antitoxin system Phd/YefM family antitoxin n=1 Tax=Streptomyces sp. NBC_00286 TaxID=2975701 RepID=UPI002E2D170C|nr:type II toxin-antitoxin system prevent-host-death family antitoxin [Streptomyces sp. NBC_00286]